MEILPLVQQAAPPQLVADVALLVETNEYYIEAFEAADWVIQDVDPATFDIQGEAYEQALVPSSHS